MNRIARNISTILREESHFSKVADTTAGSYYVEALVKQIIEKVKEISNFEFRISNYEGLNSKSEILNSKWQSPETIEVKSVYTKSDIKDFTHLNFTSGLPPYLRGPYATMRL